MTEILIIKHAALGDVLRTTSILPGLKQRYPDARICWCTANIAVSLVSQHPLVDQVLRHPPVEGPSPDLPPALGEGQSRWDLIFSFDDEEHLCQLATDQAGGLSGVERGILHGAYMGAEVQGKAPDRRCYTKDTAPWFDMGLISVHGKERADQLKIENTRTHPEIYADMLGIEMGKPELPIPKPAMDFASEFARRTLPVSRDPLIGLNTGAGGRWSSKRLSVEQTIEVACEISKRQGGKVSFMLMGGYDESERNAEIAAGLEGKVRFIDPGTRNTLLNFGALVARTHLVLTSDSLAMHVAIALNRYVVAFFAPTSAAEIELYGRGEKVVSTAPDACTYKPDVDTSTLTTERLADAVDRQLKEATAK